LCKYVEFKVPIDTIGHLGDQSFQAITCTGNDKQVNPEKICKNAKHTKKLIATQTGLVKKEGKHTKIEPKPK